MDSAARQQEALHHLQGYSCLKPNTRNERLRLNRRVEKGELVKLYHDIYVPSDWWNAQNPLTQHVCLAYACAAAHPDWIFCHTTAAALWNLNPPYARLNRLHVAVPTTSHPQNTAIVQFHRFKVLDFAELNGLRVTTCERAAIDCMRTLPFLDGLAIADAATRRNHWDNLHLARYVDNDLATPLHGISQAKLVALIADGKSESGGESIARGNMIRCGFMLPDLQTEIVGRSSGHHYRVDFSWQVTRFSSQTAPFSSEANRDDALDDSAGLIIGELDGKTKYLDASMTHGDGINTILDERRRESELTLESRAIVRFSYQEACSAELLSKKLDAFGVPRACDPLTFTRDRRHNTREVIRYLKANERWNESVTTRLAYLLEKNDGLPY